MAQHLRPVDPSTIPQLSGRFEPVDHEIDADDLPVEGSLPTDLTGCLLPQRAQSQVHAPRELHLPVGGRRHDPRALDRGTAGPATPTVGSAPRGWRRRSGRADALYGGLMTPAFVDMALLGPDPDPGWPFRLDPFVNVVRHAGRYLALEEGTPPYEITDRLETVGLFDFAGGLPAGMCAHPKIDPLHRRAGRVPLRRRGAVPHLGGHRSRRDGHPAADGGRRGRRRLHDP